MRIRGCIFDLDGTLLNTLPSIRYFLNRALAAHGVREITEDETRYFVGNGARLLVERALAADGRTDPDLLARVLPDYNESYDRDFAYLTEPYPGIPEAIDALRDAGLSLAVLSNKPDSTTRQLIARFFGERIRVVHGGREGVPLKPDPTAPLAICRELGLSPSEVAYFGDTSVDIRTGHAMGAALTCGVLWGFRDRTELEDAGSDRILSAPSEIAPTVFSL